MKKLDGPEFTSVLRSVIQYNDSLLKPGANPPKNVHKLKWVAQSETLLMCSQAKTVFPLMRRLLSILLIKYWQRRTQNLSNALSVFPTLIWQPGGVFPMATKQNKQQKMNKSSFIFNTKLVRKALRVRLMHAIVLSEAVIALVYQLCMSVHSKIQNYYCFT